MNTDLELPLITQQTTFSQDHKFDRKDRSSKLIFDNYVSEFSFRRISNYAQYLTFLDVFPLLKRINQTKNPVTLDALPAPYEDFNIVQKSASLERNWKDESKNVSREPSILRSVFKSYSFDLILCSLLCIGTSISYLLSSFLLGKLISIVTLKNIGSDTQVEDLIYYTLVYIITTFINTSIDHWYSYCSMILGGNMKFCLTALVYKKVNTIALSSVTSLDLGKIINVLAHNLNSLDSLTTFIFPMIFAPFNVILCCYIMWNFFGAYSIISLLCQVGFMVLTVSMSKLSESPLSKMNSITDSRIKYTNELIENIRLIKLYAWEKPIRAIIEGLRNQEHALLNKVGMIEAFGRSITDNSLNICVLVTFSVYALNGGILSPESVYTTMIVLDFTKIWVILFFHLGMMQVISANLTRKRVQEILQTDEIISLDDRNNNVQEDEFMNSENIIFKNFTAYWDKNQAPCLSHITTEIRAGKLTIVIGRIRSGKTSLLLSFLKEVPHVSGTLYFKGKIAYVEQEPVIFSGSVRDNILFGQIFEEAFYKKVIKACNLEEDFYQFDYADQTIVGERGITLSGGQKARLSLARALYSQSDIYLLDDPLSAVDSQVGKVIFHKAIKDILKDKTVILVTHHLSYAQQADRIIIMNEGTIEADGDFSSLLHKNISLLDLFVKENAEVKRDDQDNILMRRKSSFNPRRKSSNDSQILLHEEKKL